MPIPSDVAIRWLGHSTILIDTPGGKRIVIDPWLEGNPSCPDEYKTLDRCDIMLITHGHFDHFADALSLYQRTKAQVACVYEVALWLGARGVENPIGMNKGGTTRIGDIAVTMTPAVHSSSILNDDGTFTYAGEPVGYVVTLENGFRFYHSGDTTVFGDMKLIAELYQPEVGALSIGDLFTGGPREANLAARYLGLKGVIPIHWGTFPLLTGTPAALRDLTADIPGFVVYETKPGEIIRDPQ
ncbi:MAG: metal-dependent hydrolase [Dehalococcoidia bacterium]|nr:metal-dependent hydrolase [Dehalococcoidia bacterium]